MTRRTLLSKLSLAGLLGWSSPAWALRLPQNRVAPLPLAPLQLDPSSSLVKGMRDCIILANQAPVGGGFPNLAAPRFPAVLTVDAGLVTLPMRMTSLGVRGLYCTGASPYLAIANHDGTMATANCAVHVLCQPVSWPADYTALYDYSNNAFTREMSLFLSTSGNVLYYAMGPDGSSDQGAVWTAATALTPGRVWSLLIERVGASTTTAYVDGQAVNPTVALETLTADSSGAWYLGVNSSGGGANPDVIYLSVQAWNRTLTVPEKRALAQDPFGFLLPSPDDQGVAFLQAATRRVRSGIF